MAFGDEVMVQECGCFGEAYTLSHKATWAKNVVLLLLALLYAYLCVTRTSCKRANSGWSALYGLLFSVAIPLYSVLFLPPFDFLPYPRGGNLLHNDNFSLYNSHYTNVADSVLSGSTLPQFRADI